MAGRGSAPDRKPNCWRWRQRARTDRHGTEVSTRMQGVPPCQPGDISGGSQDAAPLFELDKLPEDILCHILSLLPLPDAARAACVSHRCLRSWRCFPNLTFNQKTFGLKLNEGTSYARAKKLVDRIDHIIQNHSGIGVKTLKLDVRCCAKVITAGHLDSWLQATIRSGILDISVELPQHLMLDYNPPCSLLSCAGSSLQSISLFSCAFHPTLRIGCLKSLKSVCLNLVHTTGEEIQCLFSGAISLEYIELTNCNETTFLIIPSHLQELSTLKVYKCTRLQTIEIYAPNLTTFLFSGPPMEILISNSSQLKYMTMHGVYYSGMIQYAQTKLQSIVSKLQTLTLSSSEETFNMPVLPGFLHLKRLKIYFCGTGYDYFSLVFFLEACPALETFFLSTGEYVFGRQDTIPQDFNADSLHIRRIPGFHHASLKKVSINQFFSSKSLIELTCQIVENTSSLRYLVLDTTSGFDPRGTCKGMNMHAIRKAHCAVEAVERYIVGKVPSTVKFKVLEPCSQCHVANL
nr:FBD-associated F-box protein At5g56370-like isoform X1 [Setaria viridis]